MDNATIFRLFMAWGSPHVLPKGLKKENLTLLSRSHVI